MARRATVIQEARASGQPTLVVDAGNSLTYGQGEAGSAEPAERTRGQTSVEALNRLGYDAVALGNKDTLLGKVELQKRLAEAKGFSFLSANLVDKSTGQLFAKPYVIKEVGGQRVALIGITNPTAEGAEFSVTPPLSAAREYVRRAQSEAGIIILLSNAGASTNKTIAEQVPGVDVIISGGSEPLRQPLRVGQGALVVQADVSVPYDAGRNIGRLRVDFDRAGMLENHSWTPINLDPKVADDPDLAAWVQSLPPQ